MNLTFSRLDDSEINVAFDVLKQVIADIQVKGRRQRIVDTTFADYQAWQAEAANFVVKLDDEIVGLVTVRREILEGWSDFVQLGSVIMLRALATHPNHRGQQIGEFAVVSAVQKIGDESVYLDCVDGFLPDYYERLGFQVVARQQRQSSDSAELDLCLMKYSGSL